jgi:hypothetical protein
VPVADIIQGDEEPHPISEDEIMTRTMILALGGALLIAVGARGSDPVGVYALIDKVVLEPKEGPPERIQVWGVFVLASQGGAHHTAPLRGYMDFKLAVGNEENCRREWADLKKIAGTDDVVAFGNSRAATGAVRRMKQESKPADPLDADRLKALIDNLGSEQFETREIATHELQKQGKHAYVELRKALEGKVSAEARRRIEQLLATAKPDTYPLGYGLVKLEGRHGDYWRNQLRSLPEPVSPAEGAAVAAGKVTLKIKNIACTDHTKAGYVFEIEDAAGGKEVSQTVEAGAKETEWSPRLEVQAGKRYTWRVRPVDGEWKGPAAETVFQGK